MTSFGCVDLTLLVGGFLLSHCFYWIINVGVVHAF